MALRRPPDSVDRPGPLIVPVRGSGGWSGDRPRVVAQSCCSQPRYDAEKAFWTSRGCGVADVDHGGSTGQGRAYRELLRGQWGVVDVQDCEAVTRWLLATGRASAVVIRGGSAGGWTVLCALTRGDSVFAAGTSYFGVADLLPFATSTHDFESHYLDGLVGPLPEARALYETRSPLSQVDRLDRPLLILQGLDDKVVPPAQAELLLAALADKQAPYPYLAYPGEGTASPGPRTSPPR